MVINTAPEKDVTKSFSRRKIAVNILLWTAVSGSGLGFFTISHHDPFTLTGLSYGAELGLWWGITVIALVAAFYFWRCPDCHKFIGFTFHSESCEYCGAKFVQTEEITDSDAIVIMRRKRIQLNLIMGAMLLVGALLMILSIRYGTWLAIVGVAIFLLAWPFSRHRIRQGPLIISYFIWRCPKCDEYLGDEENPEECPNCHTKLS